MCPAMAISLRQRAEDLVAKSAEAVSNLTIYFMLRSESDRANCFRACVGRDNHSDRLMCYFAASIACLFRGGGRGLHVKGVPFFLDERYCCDDGLWAIH